MSKQEALSFYSDIQDLINEMGEKIKISRAGATLTNTLGVFGKIDTSDVNSSGNTPVSSEKRILTIIASTKYYPDLLDVVQDSHKNIYQIASFTVGRYMDTNITYNLSIT